MADAAKLKQVLYNYLSNALKFTPEEGRVTIRVTPEGDQDFRIEVEDTSASASRTIVVKSDGAAALVEELDAYVSPGAGSGPESRRGR